MKDVHSLTHSKWRGQYHIVFAPKFRRKEIYGKIKADIGQILRELCEQKGVEIIEAETYLKHIHKCLIWLLIGHFIRVVYLHPQRNAWLFTGAAELMILFGQDTHAVTR